MALLRLLFSELEDTVSLSTAAMSVRKAVILTCSKSVLLDLPPESCQDFLPFSRIFPREIFDDLNESSVLLQDMPELLEFPPDLFFLPWN
jgi:hypothetical protein